MQLIKEIESDFDQSFRDVVAGFAQDGHEPKSIAQILEVPESVIRKHCPSRLFAKPIERKSAPVEKPPENVPNGTGVKRTVSEKWRQALRENGKKGYKNARWITYQGIYDTFPNHCKRLGINQKTARNRYKKRPDDLEWVFYTGRHDPNARKG